MNDEIIRIRVVIDRIEGNLAVLEMPELEQVLLPVSYVPEGCGDGAILEITVRRDVEEEEAQRQKVANLRKGPGAKKA